MMTQVTVQSQIIVKSEQGQPYCLIPAPGIHTHTHIHLQVPNSDKRLLSGLGEKGETLTERHWDCSMHLSALPTIKKT